MIPETIIKAAAKDGIRLAISSNGTLKAAGKRSAMRRWSPIIRERKAEVLAVLGSCGGGATENTMANSQVSHCWWRIQYAGCATLEIAYCPPVSQAEVEAGEPGAVAVEPFEPVGRLAETRLSSFQEALIRRWLAKIGETDVDIISDLLDRCQADADAREYFLKFAECRFEKKNQETDL